MLALDDLADDRLQGDRILVVVRQQEAFAGELVFLISHEFRLAEIGENDQCPMRSTTTWPTYLACANKLLAEDNKPLPKVARISPSTDAAH